jgi:hypothetical protein
MFKKYLDSTGIAMAFQVVFAEILDKKIDSQKVFQYTAMRLRQIGEDLEKIKLVSDSVNGSRRRAEEEGRGFGDLCWGLEKKRRSWEDFGGWMDYNV